MPPPPLMQIQTFPPYTQPYRTASRPGLLPTPLHYKNTYTYQQRQQTHTHIRNSRQNTTRTQKQSNWPIDIYTNTLRAEPDLDTRTKAKQYFKIIQITHHKHIIEEANQQNTVPKGFQRQVSKLTEFIKPAAPTTDTLALIQNNTKQWMASNIQILNTHYTTQFTTLLQKQTTPYNHTAFQIASGWARKRYGNRFSDTTLSTIHHIFLQPDTDTNNTLDLTDPDEFPPLTDAPQQPDLDSTTSSTPTPTQPDPLDNSPTHEHPPPQNTLPDTIHTTQESMSIQTNIRHSLTPLSSGPPLMTTHQAEAYHQQDVTLELHNLPKTCLHKDLIHPSIHSNIIDHTTDNIVPFSQGSQEETTTLLPPKLDRALMISCNSTVNQLTSSTTEPSSTTPEPSSPNSPPHSTHQAPIQFTSTQPILQQSIPNPHTEHTQQTHIQPTYHRVPNPKEKLKHWTIQAHKTTLILGDSNLHRIPPYSDNGIQIDSYPGATIYHLYSLLKQTTPLPEVEKVILSIGINNMDHDPKNTNPKQLSLLYKQALITFPNALIHIPQINFSDLLKPTQKQTLAHMNNYISAHFPHIPTIPSTDFYTTHDKIHWTSTTAQIIFKHWCTFLNLI